MTQLISAKLISTQVPALWLFWTSDHETILLLCKILTVHIH